MIKLIMKKFLMFVFICSLLVACNETPKEEIKPMSKDSDIIEFEDYEEEPMPVQETNNPTPKLSLQDQLIQAIRTVDKNQVKALITQGVKVNELKQEKRMVSCGPACDGYEIVEYSPLHVALETEKENKKYKARTEEDLKSDEIYNTKEELLAYLKEYEQKEKDMAEIIKLLKSKGAKDIYQKIL